ncbi:MAG: helix-turn-helix domain-containing protein, partial [Eisenbergiella sp.]
LEHTRYSFLEKYGGVPDEVYPDDTRLLFNTALTVKDHFRKWAVSMLACLRGFYDRQKGNSIVREIKAYLEDHYPQDITLQNLAEDFNYSKDYITKIFRQEEGCGPFEYLAEYRVKQSCILLGDARLSVGEIASMTGFNSISIPKRSVNSWEKARKSIGKPETHPARRMIRRGVFPLSNR